MLARIKVRGRRNARIARVDRLPILPHPARPYIVAQTETDR